MSEYNTRRTQSSFSRSQFDGIVEFSPAASYQQQNPEKSPGHARSHLESPVSSSGSNPARPSSDEKIRVTGHPRRLNRRVWSIPVRLWRDMDAELGYSPNFDSVKAAVIAAIVRTGRTWEKALFRLVCSAKNALGHISFKHVEKAFSVWFDMNSRSVRASWCTVCSLAETFWTRVECRSEESLSRARTGAHTHATRLRSTPPLFYVLKGGLQAPDKNACPPKRNPKGRRLDVVGLVCHRHECSSDGMFHMGSVESGKILEMDDSTAWRHLNAEVKSGRLKLISRGNSFTGMANVYRVTPEGIEAYGLEPKSSPVDRTEDVIHPEVYVNPVMLEQLKMRRAGAEIGMETGVRIESPPEDESVKLAVQKYQESGRSVEKTASSRKNCRMDNGITERRKMEIHDVIGVMECVHANTSGGWDCRCPAHETRTGRTNNMSVAVGDDGKVLLHCHAGCSQEEVLAAVREKLGHTCLGRGSRNERRPMKPVEQKQKRTFDSWEHAAASLSRQYGNPSMSWPYYREGAIVGYVLRWDTATGKEIRPISLVDGSWAICAMPEPRPLYCRVPQPCSQDPKCVYVVEGEKTADAMSSIGCVTFTSSGGSGSAHKTDWTPLKGKRVAILPDNDAPGEKYAAVVAELLKEAEAEYVTICRLPGLGDGEDAYEFIERLREENWDMDADEIRGRIVECVRSSTST